MRKSNSRCFARQARAKQREFAAGARIGFHLPRDNQQ
jgi:hypothetical protein